MNEVVEVDPLGFVSLRSLGWHRRYWASVEVDGVIVLRPDPDSIDHELFEQHHQYAVSQELADNLRAAEEGSP